MENIYNDFRKALINSINFREPIIAIGEVLIDSKIRNVLLKEIPILSWISKAVTIVDKIKTEFLVDKIISFLNNLSEIDKNEIIEFESNYLSDGGDLEKFYSTLLVAIDRIDHLEKMQILANLFTNFIKGNIDEAFFLRSFNIVQTIYFNDLKDYISNKIYFSYEEAYDHLNVTHSFLSLGLLTFRLVDIENSKKRLANETNLKFHYIHSDFGFKFIEACKVKGHKN